MKFHLFLFFFTTCTTWQYQAIAQIKKSEENRPVTYIGSGGNITYLGNNSKLSSTLFNSHWAVGIEIMYGIQLNKNIYLHANLGIGSLSLSEAVVNNPATYMDTTNMIIIDSKKLTRHTYECLIAHISEAVGYTLYSKWGEWTPYGKFSLYSFDYNIEKLFFRTNSITGKSDYVLIDAHKAQFNFSPSIGCIYSLPITRVFHFYATADVGYIVGSHKIRHTEYLVNNEEIKYYQKLKPYQLASTFSIGFKLNIYKILN